MEVCCLLYQIQRDKKVERICHCVSDMFEKEEPKYFKKIYLFTFLFILYKFITYILIFLGRE